MDLNKIKQSVEADLNNLKEAQKLPIDKKVEAFIKRTKQDIDVQVRLIGRTYRPKAHNIRLNKVAYQIGEDWLEARGIIV